MTQIWKFPLQMADEQTVSMPKGAKILCVQSQRGTPCLWALVENGKPTEHRLIQMCGTGHYVDSVGKYVGTFQLEGGFLIFHVFDKGVV